MAVATTERELAEVIERHLPLVKHIVFQVAVHFPRHVDRQDLARAGALGLMEAAHRYDAERGVPFERFASQRIRGAILDAVRAADWAPRSLRNSARKLESTRQQLSSDLGRAPTVQEIADELGMSAADVSALQDRIHRTVVLALDEHVTSHEDEDLTLVDVLCDRTSPEPSEELEGRELRAFMRDAVHLLPERHRLVIVGYFLEGRTSQDLARFLGVTESRVSQVRSEALGMLREGINAQFERDAAHGVPAKGRVARRKAAYAAAIASRTTWQTRLDGRADAAATATVTMSRRISATA